MKANSHGGALLVRRLMVQQFSAAMTLLHRIKCWRSAMQFLTLVQL
jgi:hypothetical protein